MDAKGRNAIQAALGNLYVSEIEDGVEEQRYVTVGLTDETGQSIRHDIIFEALHQVGLMAKQPGGPRDLSLPTGPALRVTSWTDGFMTFEDLNYRS